MYTSFDYPTKKALKADVDDRNNLCDYKASCLGNAAPAPEMWTEELQKKLNRLSNRLQAYQPGGMFPGTTNGKDVIEGPHYPKPHKWYASVVLADSIVVKAS